MKTVPQQFRFIEAEVFLPQGGMIVDPHGPTWLVLHDMPTGTYGFVELVEIDRG